MFTFSAYLARLFSEVSEAVVIELSDTVSEARPAATSILVRFTDQSAEVLLLKRNETLKHMPGLWVFPGGKVESYDPGADAREQARHGAARELQEEAGVSLSPAQLTPFSHWLTPVVVKRRFSTWFFLTEVDDDTPVTVDGSEITAHQWWRPSEAVAAHHSGALPLTPPTLVSLHDLQGLEASRDGWAALSTRSPAHYFPNVVRDAETMVFLYEGDASYESGDLNLQGAVHRTLGKAGIFYYEPLSPGA